MSKQKINITYKPGISIGSLLAAFISWSINKSVGWALVHAFFGWLYVFYYLVGCAGTMPQ